MQSVFKTLLALALGIGFLALETHAKTVVAFLGIDPDTDPRFGKALSTLIHQELAADTALVSLPPKAIDDFLAKRELVLMETGPADIAKLKQGLDAGFYAIGWLEPLSVANKRVWWMPWSVRTNWTQDLRLRVLDGKTGEVVYDAKVPVEIPEKHFLSGPEGNHSKQGALERDSRYRRMLPLLSAETAKAVSKVIGERTGTSPEAGAGAAAAAVAPGAK